MELEEKCHICQTTLLSCDVNWTFYSCGHFVCASEFCTSRCGAACDCRQGYYLPNATLSTNTALQEIVSNAYYTRFNDPIHYLPWLQHLHSFLSTDLTCPNCSFYTSQLDNCPCYDQPWQCPKCENWSSTQHTQCTACRKYTNLDLVSEEFAVDGPPEERKEVKIDGNAESSGTWKCQHCGYEYNLETKCLKCNKPKIPTSQVEIPSEQRMNPVRLEEKARKAAEKDQKAKKNEEIAGRFQEKTEEKKEFPLSSEERKSKTGKVQGKVEENKEIASKSEAKASANQARSCKCGREIEGFETVCRACASPEAVGETVPPWICLECNTNYCVRSKCQVCGAPRSQKPVLPESSPPPSAVSVPQEQCRQVPEVHKPAFKAPSTGSAVRPAGKHWTCKKCGCNENTLKSHLVCKKCGKRRN